MTIDTRLAVYGTLAPGRSNHHQLSGLSGAWIAGSVRGRLIEKGWGVDHGYPAIILDPAGPEVAVQLFVSADLAAHWQRLDEFEGDGYRRVPVMVTSAEGPVEAWIYAEAGEA
jgi:gamma-glutamylcyclotransferase (GGCT)/AIG2-like uncharacterized protein YtfP